MRKTLLLPSDTRDRRADAILDGEHRHARGAGGKPTPRTRDEGKDGNKTCTGSVGVEASVHSGHCTEEWGNT